MQHDPLPTSHTPNLDHLIEQQPEKIKRGSVLGLICSCVAQPVRDIKVSRLDQTVTTKQALRITAKHTSKPKRSYPEYWELPPTSFSRRARNTKRLAPVVIPQTSTAPRCVHEVLCKPGEKYSDICQACRRGFGPWEETRKPLNVAELSVRRHTANDIDTENCNEEPTEGERPTRGDTVSCDAEGATQPEVWEEPRTKKTVSRISTPTKAQSAAWNKIFHDAKLPVVSRDHNTVSLMVEADAVDLGDHVEKRYADARPKRNYHDRTEAQVFEAQQEWKRRGRMKLTCKRCGDVFWDRKGTKHCSDNCRKRHHEEQTRSTQ